MLKPAAPTAGPSWLARLTALPRDARDTLFLLFVVALVVLPQAQRLPLWCLGLFLLALLWRGALAVLARPLPGRWWLLGLLALAVGATFFSFRTLLGREAGVSLLVILLALKTLEMRARRDALVVFFLGFFVILTNFFVSQSIFTAAAMLLATLGMLMALVNAHMPSGRPSLLAAGRIALRLALLGAPVMAALFLLFPRLSPLWGIPADGHTGRSGLSSTMQVGNVARLALDEAVAMRIRFAGDQVPPASQLYFRGPVLAHFDGREWRALDGVFTSRWQPPAHLRGEGPVTEYEVTLEPNNRNWLFLLEAATGEAPRVPGYDVKMTPDLQWTLNRPLTDLVRYTGRSQTQFGHGPQRFYGQLQDYLELPTGFNPRTLALAGQMSRDPAFANADAQAFSRAALERLRSGGFIYTLEPGLYGQHSADEFWFDRKEGFCEHIASAYVVLMRALGVPARIVTGYQGGERNPVDGFWTLRQSDAHAWAEIWQAGIGWIRVDPTSAVAPGRVGALQRLPAPRGVVANAINAVSPGFALQWRALWEAINNGWSQWVLNYTQSRQFDLLRHIGFSSPSWEQLGYVLAALLVLTSLAGGAWALFERVRHDPWLRLLERARQRLARGGLASRPTTPPRELARLLQMRHGASSAALQQWLLALEAQRYASAPAASLPDLRRRFRSLPWPA